MTGQRITPMWRKPSPGAAKRLDRVLQRALVSRPEKPVVYFRADDIGIPSRSSASLLEIFAGAGVPCNLAVVPSWLTPSRLKELKRSCSARGYTPEQWCWHQHGRRHRNHEPKGRKSEFGPARSLEAKRRDLRLGRERLEGILGNEFNPVLTPPWNRLDQETALSLRELGFEQASRNEKSMWRQPSGLSEFPVHADLHTRKEDSGRAWSSFFAELEYGLSKGVCGVMLHHDRMNGVAIDYLRHFLDGLAARRIPVVTFKQLCMG